MGEGRGEGLFLRHGHGSGVARLRARYFFDKGRTLVAQKNLDPAGYGGDVGSYINTQEKIQEAVAKFQLAYDRAIKAEDYATRGYTKDAVDMWIKIFGSYFPTYG
jgi:hypothetical protein